MTRVAISMFGRFDVTTLRDIVEFSECDAIYVADVARLRSATPAIVASEHVSVDELDRELHFRFLSDVDDAREMV